MADQIPAGVFTATPIAPVYLGGLPLSDVVGTAGLNQIAGASKQTTAANFWSTPERLSTDPTREIFEVNLNGTKKVNAVAFDLPRFPHLAYLLYKDSDGDWVAAQTIARKPVVISITDSIPSLLLPYHVITDGNIHPQHYGAGHWIHYEQSIAPVNASQFRLVLLRQQTPNVPIGGSKKPVPYSLGVRGFNVGYKIANRADVPLSNRSADVVTETETFASTIDLLGSPVEISIRENRASDLLAGAMWKSEPQPTTNAVVCLYADARDSMGQAQVVDRFYIDPITSGVHVNLYYSATDPDQADFTASDDPFTFPKAIPGGIVQANAGGLLFPDDIGFIDLDNAVTQFDAQQPYWLGLVIQPQFDPTDTDRHVIIDNGWVRFEWTGAAWQVSVGPTTIVRTDIDFDVNTQLGFAIGFDGARTHFYTSGDGDGSDYSADTPVSPMSLNAKIRVGGLIDADPHHGNYRLLSLVLKSEAPPARSVYNQYFTDPSGYVVKPEFAIDDQGTTNNAILRYDTFYQTFGAASVNPYGFVGGASDIYADIVWTPINRDYTLAKGFMVFDPVLARYFKFEFSNLSAQPYDAPAPTTVQIKTFPVASYYSKPSVVSSGNTAGGGAAAQSDAAASAAIYEDQVRLSQTPQPTSTYSPTQALFSPDPNTASRMRVVSPYYALREWQFRWEAPRFVNVTKHVYETMEVAFTERIAYFVALNALQMYRVDYTTDDDTDQYLESFLDLQHIEADGSGDIGGWGHTPGQISTPSDLVTPVVLTSAVFSSRQGVTALQFASVQSPPVQMLHDPDFNDPSLQYWAPVGDGNLSNGTIFNSDIGTLVKVTRNPVDNFWTTIENRYSSWDDIEASDPSPDAPVWDDLEESGTSVPIGGIKSTEAISSSNSGRLYAAGRVYSPVALTAPLYLQIVDSDGNVLAQESVTVDPGRLVEWYVAYTLGEGGDSTDLTWDNIEAGPSLSPDVDPLHPTWDELEALGSWDQLDTTTSPLIGDVTAQMVQIVPSSDSWYVDNISVFDDSIVWEFSNDGGTTWWPVYDIRNDPYGVFVFPDDDVTSPTQGYGLQYRVTGNQPGQQVSALSVRPWYGGTHAVSAYRETIQAAGPNVGLGDHYNSITQDPRFKMWHNPIPEDWWWIYRQTLLRQHPVVPPKPPIIVPHTVAFPLDEGSPPAPPAADLYLSDVFVVD